MQGRMEQDYIADDIAVDNAVYPYTIRKSTVVFGGHETWVKALKPPLKGDIKFIAREMKIDVSLVRYADVIWLQSNAIPHRSYYSIVNTPGSSASRYATSRMQVRRSVRSRSWRMIREGDGKTIWQWKTESGSCGA